MTPKEIIRNLLSNQVFTTIFIIILGFLATEILYKYLTEDNKKNVNIKKRKKV